MSAGVQFVLSQVVSVRVSLRVSVRVSLRSDTLTSHWVQNMPDDL